MGVFISSGYYLNSLDNIIVELIRQGKSNEQIATVLNYTQAGVKRRIRNLFKLFRVRNRIELSRKAEIKSLGG